MGLHGKFASFTFTTSEKRKDRRGFVSGALVGRFRHRIRDRSDTSGALLGSGSPLESPTYLPLSDSGASLQLARMKREILAHLELHPVDLRQKT